MADLESPDAVTRFWLIRNLPMERWVTGQPQPFAPLYDVEEIDAWHVPVRVLVTAVGAEAARDAIARAGGVEVPR